MVLSRLLGIQAGSRIRSYLLRDGRSCYILFPNVAKVGGFPHNIFAMLLLFYGSFVAIMLSRLSALLLTTPDSNIGTATWATSPARYG